jgi:hypothetical protein
MTFKTLASIFVGNVGNDGTGDKLRTAFIKTNDNFTDIDDYLKTVSDVLTFGDHLVTVDRDMIAIGDVTVEGNLRVLGNTIVEHTYININNLETEDRVIIDNETQAGDHTQGALVVAGGVGIGKNVWINGDEWLHTIWASVDAHVTANTLVGGRVGVGTDFPDYGIDLYGNTVEKSAIRIHNGILDSSMVFSVNPTGYAYINQSYPKPLVFCTSNNEAARIDEGSNVMVGYTSITSDTEKSNFVAAGQVGIGTNVVTSGYKLDIVGNIILSEINPELRFNYGGSWILGGENAMYIGTDSTASPSNIKVVITNDGHVGIDTSEQLGNSHLDVNLGITARTTADGNTPFLQLHNENAAADLKTWRIGGYSAGQLRIETINDAYTTPTLRMMIDASSNTGINTVPAYRLDVKTDAAGIDGIHVTDGTQSVWLRPNMNPGDSNPIVQEGDTGIIYTNGAMETGAFVIAPWSSTNSGLRINATGDVELTSIKSRGKMTFGAGQAYADSTTTDSFVISTKADNPDAKFQFNIGDGHGGISFNPIHWNHHLAFSGDGRADQTPDVNILANGMVGIGVANPVASLQIGNGNGLKRAYILGDGYDLILGTGGGSMFGYASKTISTVFNNTSVPLGVGTGQNTPLIFGTNGTERARFTEVGRFGINTIAPAYKFHVYSQAADVDASAIQISSVTTDTAFMTFRLGSTGAGALNGSINTDGTNLSLKASGALGFYANGARRIYIDTDGSVYIGPSTRVNTGFANKLTVNGGIVAGSAGSTTGSVILQGYYGNGALTTFGTEHSSGGPSLGYAVYPDATSVGGFLSSSPTPIDRAAYNLNGNHDWYVAGPQTVGTGSPVAMTRAMRLSGDSVLSINGVRNDAQLNVTSSVRGGIFVRNTSNDAGITVINSGSNAGIYSTTDGANYGLFGRSEGYYGIFGKSTAASFGGVLGYSPDGSKYGILGFNGYSVYCNGPLYGTSFVKASDANLKENIVSITGALEKVLALNPVTFDWRANSEQGVANGGPLADAGLIAQQVETVFPEIVYQSTTPSRHSENTGPVTIEEELGTHKGVDYTKLIPYLTAAICEQHTLIESLTARVAALENK